MSMDFSDVPRYLQLAAILREQIEAGEIPEHHPIPSKLVLKQAYSVSGSTIDRAVKVLRAEGKLVTIPGLGLYVRERKDWRKPAAD